jgi:hypothetical protein
MPHLLHSTHARHRLGDLLATRGLTVEALAGLPGVDPAEVRALIADERLMPSLRFLDAVYVALGTHPAELIVWDASAAPPLGTPDEPFGVTVVGAGNLGHVLVGLLGARPELRVNVLVSSEERATLLAGLMTEGVTVTSPNGSTVGRPSLVTADPAAALPGAGAVLLCLPSHLQVEALRRIVPYLEPGTTIGALPAPGGFDWKARCLLADAPGVTIFGLGSIPWMCKLAEAGRHVRVLGSKLLNGLELAGPGPLEATCELLADLIGQPVLALRSFLQITLNPGNQLLHPGIMYAKFRDWEGRPLPEPPLFYEGLSDEAAAVLQALSDEVMLLRGTLEARLPGLHLSVVLPLHLSVLVGYGEAIGDPSTLRSTIATNSAYAGIRTPMQRVDGGYVPDWSSRFFWEDVPHGLVVLRGIADLAGVAVPKIDRVLAWAQGRMGTQYLVDGRLVGPDLAESGAPQAWGITSLAQLG